MSEIETVAVSKIELEQSLLGASIISISPRRLLQKGSRLPDLVLPAVVRRAVHGVPDQGRGGGGGGDAGGEVGGEAEHSRLPPISSVPLSQLYWTTPAILSQISPGWF